MSDGGGESCSWSSWGIGSAFSAPQCRTPTLRSAPGLLPPTANDVYRPASAGFHDSDVYPLRVHYRRAADADRALTVILPALEEAWAGQIEEIGWPAPPPDNQVGGSDAFDVYLTNEETYGGAYVWGFGPDVIPDDNWFSVPSYMALDESIPDANMLSWVAHELNHASQYTIDAHEHSTFIWEATAEAITDVVDDESNYYIVYDAMQDFQEFPFLSLVFDGYRRAVIEHDNNSFYEYGGIIFGMFIEQRFGTNDGTTLLALWDALAQPEDSLQPDFLDALATLDPSAPSLAHLYTEFALWRMFTGELDDGAHFEEAGLWGPRERVGLEAVLTLEQAHGYLGQPSEPPYDLGTSYYAVTVDQPTEEHLLVEVVGEEGTQWGLVWAVWPAEGPALTGTLVADGVLEADIPLEGGVRVQIGVVNAAPADMTAPGPVPRRSFDLALSVVTPEPPAPQRRPLTGTAPPVSDALATGCGCGPASPGPSLVPFLLGLLALRRRPYRRWQSTRRHRDNWARPDRL